jgi:hypothetical protein
MGFTRPRKRFLQVSSIADRLYHTGQIQRAQSGRNYWGKRNTHRRIAQAPTVSRTLGARKRQTHLHSSLPMVTMKLVAMKPPAKASRGAIRRQRQRQRGKEWILHSRILSRRCTTSRSLKHASPS